VIPYQPSPRQFSSAILIADNELAAAPEQTPTQFQIGPDVEIISLD
jgi:hypothetical protein